MSDIIPYAFRVREEPCLVEDGQKLPKPAHIIQECPLSVNFEEQAVTLHNLDSPVFGKYPGWMHVILKDEAIFPGAISTFYYEPRPSHRTPESLGMSWNLQYRDGSPATEHLSKLQRSLGKIEDAYDISEWQDPEPKAYIATYAFKSPRRSSLLAAINYRDRIVQLTNQYHGQDTRIRRQPVPFSEVSMHNQLFEFGKFAATMGRVAIPDIAGQQENLN